MNASSSPGPDDPKPQRALVVEDDPDIAVLLTEALTSSGFDVVATDNGPASLVLFEQHRPDLVTLDLGLPGMDGVEVCRRIREISDCYIIMLTARHEEIDKLIGLEVGADDYMPKPFSVRELRARVAALFRRPRRGTAPIAAAAASESRGRPVTTIDAGAGLVIDANAREVRIDGELVDLTRTEYDLLLHLAQRPGSVCSRADLLEDVWDTSYTDETHVVAVHMGNLRRKLRDHAPTEWIRTVRGIGYRFDVA